MKPTRVDHDAIHAIGTLRETSLHAALKALYARPGDHRQVLHEAAGGGDAAVCGKQAGDPPKAGLMACVAACMRGRSVREVLDESRQVFQQLLAVIEGLPDEVLIEPEWHLVWLDDKRFPAGEFFDHFRDDHEPDMRAWLARVENQ